MSKEGARQTGVQCGSDVASSSPPEPLGLAGYYEVSSHIEMRGRTSPA